MNRIAWPVDVVRKRAVVALTCFVGVGLAGMCALAACGGGRADPLRQAADATTRETSGKVIVQAKMDFSGQITTVIGSGAFADGADDLHLTLATEGLGASKLDEIFRDGVTWLRSPELPTAIYGKQWLRLDHGERANFLGFDLTALIEQRPTAALDKLRRRGAVRTLGSETIRGVQMTHYHKALAPSGNDIVYKAADAWIDENGHVRQLTLDLTARIQPPSDQRARISVRMTFTDFGGSVTVTPPPSARVLDSDAAKNG